MNNKAQIHKALADKVVLHVRVLFFMRVRFQSQQQIPVNASSLFHVGSSQNIVFLLRQNPQPGLEP